MRLSKMQLTQQKKLGDLTTLNQWRSKLLVASVHGNQYDIIIISLKVLMFWDLIML